MQLNRQSQISQPERSLVIINGQVLVSLAGKPEVSFLVRVHHSVTKDGGGGKRDEEEERRGRRGTRRKKRRMRKRG